MLYLASQSPRRAELLTRLGVSFITLKLDIPEVYQPTETPTEYVARVAQEKAQAGKQLISKPQAIVLAADTEVVFNGRVFGKPTDADDAKTMLQTLSGQTHQVISSVCVTSNERTAQIQVISEVSFTQLSSTDINTYVATGEPMGKAGAYAIQGRGECFVTHLSGSHSAVMGLPLHQTWQLLQQFGAY